MALPLREHREGAPLRSPGREFPAAARLQRWTMSAELAAVPYSGSATNSGTPLAVNIFTGWRRPVS
jgi:hypothetical protein